MSKLFRITEDDLAELERILPQLCSSLTPVMNNRDRVHLRRCQTILSDVRWEYGPSTLIETIPADGPIDQETPDGG